MGTHMFLWRNKKIYHHILVEEKKQQPYLELCFSTKHDLYKGIPMSTRWIVFHWEIRKKNMDPLYLALWEQLVHSISNNYHRA